MVTTLAILLGVAVLMALVAWGLYCASENERERGRNYARGLLAERDAARHEAHEYKADAADLQKKLTGATAHTDKLAKALDAITNENTQIRADLHALAHKWK